MKRIATSCLQWAALIAFFAWGTFLVFVILGEEAPGAHLGLVKFFAMKAMAIGAVYVTYKAGVWCCRHKLLPDAFIQEMQKCQQEEDA